MNGSDTDIVLGPTVVKKLERRRHRISSTATTDSVSSEVAAARHAWASDVGWVSNNHLHVAANPEPSPPPMDASHPFITWFEKEIRWEFKAINEKLDGIAAKVNNSQRRAVRTYTAASASSESGNPQPRFAAWTVLPAVPESPNNPAEAAQYLIKPKAPEDFPNRPSTPPKLNQIFSAVQGTRSASKVSRASKEDSVASKPETDAASSQSVGSAPPRGPRRSVLRSSPSDAVIPARCCGISWLEQLDAVWTFLDDPASSKFASWYSKGMAFFVAVSVFFPLVESVRPPILHGIAAAVVETTVDSIFLAEFLLRLLSCPNQWRFFNNLYNIIDLFGIVPMMLRATIGFVLPEDYEGNPTCVFLVFFVPILRLLKTLRRFEQIHLLMRAFELAVEALPVLLYMLFAITLVFSVLIYLFEPRDNIESMDVAVWLTIVTMTTVGYGDVSPVSGEGRTIVGVLVVITMLYMAVPLGIIGDAFTQTWNDRDRILLMRRTRDRLNQWGYTARDITFLFARADDDGDGELDLTEFRSLLAQMHLGFSDERVLELFESFDDDGSGKVDDKEFIRALFPDEYHDIYESDRVEARFEEASPRGSMRTLKGDEGSSDEEDEEDEEDNDEEEGSPLRSPLRKLGELRNSVLQRDSGAKKDQDSPVQSPAQSPPHSARTVETGVESHVDLTTPRRAANK